MATAVLAAAVGATAFAAAPAYANPAPAPSPKIVSIDTNPNPVVVQKHGSSRVTVSVRTVDVKDVKISIMPTDRDRWWGEHGSFGGPAPSASGDYRQPVLRSFEKPFSIDWNDPVGTWKVRVLALGFDGKEYSQYGSFSVKRAEPEVHNRPKGTRIVGFDATPEPVRKGRKLVLRGKLEVAQCYGDLFYELRSYYGQENGGDCEDDRDYWHDWHYFGDQEVGVYFQPKGSGEWRYVGSVETDDDGHFATWVRAYRSGTWAVKFNGNNRLRGSEASDYVKVLNRYHHY